MINIVYHCYTVGNWEEIVLSQLNRLKKSGLYDEANEIFLTVTLSDVTEDYFKKIVSDFSKLKIDFFSVNRAEYYGIKKVREIGVTQDTKILYFHTKGVSNRYANYNLKDISIEKIENISSWRECLEYFLIDNWKECVEKLEEYDNVGVSCNNGWFWGNFWWTNSNHIKKTQEVDIWGRWDYEAWLNRSVESPKNFEFFHFDFIPYLTKIHEDWYKSVKNEVKSKIDLISAYYGTPPFEIDEGYSGSKVNVGSDVKDVVLSLLEKEGYLQFNFNVNNESMGGDPIYGHRKVLILEFTKESDKEKIYKMAFHEGHNVKI